MKKACSLFLALCLFSLGALPAYADLMIEPDNSFYERHSHECVQVRRHFYVESPEGAPVLEAPGSQEELGRVEQGQLLFVYAAYDNRGAAWGAVDFTLPGEDGAPASLRSGWVAMDLLAVRYDNISFAEDHEKDFYPYEGSLEELRTAPKVALWTYPESGELARVLDRWDDAWNDKDGNLDIAYRDTHGRQWLRLSYYEGYREVWVCLTDPANQAIPLSSQNPQTGNWQPTAPARNAIPITAIAVILVAALAVGTVILIRVLWKKGV